MFKILDDFAKWCREKHESLYGTRFDLRKWCEDKNVQMDEKHFAQPSLYENAESCVEQFRAEVREDWITFEKAEIIHARPGDVVAFHVEIGDMTVNRASDYLKHARDGIRKIFDDEIKIMVMPMRHGLKTTIEVIRQDEENEYPIA